MARRRRSYTREFKVEAVKLVTEKGYSVAEAARSLGIGEEQRPRHPEHEPVRAATIHRLSPLPDPSFPRARRCGETVSQMRTV